jgi:hypothetical protein
MSYFDVIVLKQAEQDVEVVHQARNPTYIEKRLSLE